MSVIVAGEYVQIVVFSLVDKKNAKREDYGVSIDQVREIRPLEPITKMPNSKNYVKGVMNLRGMIIPVIDVKEKLGLNGDEHGSHSRILVLDIRGKLAGLLIDDVDQVIRIPAKEIETNLSGGLESVDYVNGIAKTSGRLVVILDMERLLENQSTRKLGEV